MENKQIKKATLCWKCKNAVPTKDAGCSWSRAFQLVEGWTAEKHQQKQSGSVYETYCVISCPLFQKDGRNSADSCKDDTGCVRIAEHILRGQMNGTALHWNATPEPGATMIWHSLRSIERDLLTPYYAALTLHIIELRQKAGLPELEEM